MQNADYNQPAQPTLREILGWSGDASDSRFEERRLAFAATKPDERTILIHALRLIASERNDEGWAADSQIAKYYLAMAGVPLKP